MVIAVNIGKNITRMSAIDATKRAWKLNRLKASSHNYVIGVANGAVSGYYNLNSVFVDRREPDRVAFKLSPCTTSQIRVINHAIRGLGLSGFVTKYI